MAAQSCPPDQTCHNLSYYVSQPDHYFTSNAEFIFLEGEHRLNREEIVSVSKVDNLTLRGEGQWVAGSEETVMQSTAIIHCSKAKGGFFFTNSFIITIRTLTFKNCGGYHILPSSYIHQYHPAAIAFDIISDLILVHISVLNSAGAGLVATDCHKVQLHNSSFAYNRRDSGAIVIYTSAHGAELTVSHSNFTRGGFF